jgi:hypothetical protein
MVRGGGGAESVRQGKNEHSCVRLGCLVRVVVAKEVTEKDRRKQYKFEK